MNADTSYVMYWEMIILKHKPDSNTECLVFMWVTITKQQPETSKRASTSLFWCGAFIFHAG